MSVETLTCSGLADALTRLAQSRDAEAWALILERLGNDLARMAHALIRDDALAEDAVQETLLQIRDDAGQFSPRGADPDIDAKRWIMRLCVTTSLQLLRRRRAYEHALARDQAGSVQRAPSPPDASLMRREQEELLHTAMGELPERTRRAIALHHLGGLGFADVAHALGIPEGTAKTRVHRGMAALRGRLERQGIVMSVAACAAALSPRSAVRHLDPGATDLLRSARSPTLHLLKGSLPMVLKITLACATGLAVVVAPVARSEDGAAPAAAGSPTSTPAPSAPAERRFSFEMVRCPRGQPYLELTMQLGLSAGIDDKAFFTAPAQATVIAKNVTYDQALRMIGDATNTHFERKNGINLLTAGAPTTDHVQAMPYIAGPEADPILQGNHVTLYYGLTRNDLLDVILRMLHTNVVVDPAVMGTGDMSVTLDVKNGTVADAFAQLGVRAERRGNVVYILPLASGAPEASGQTPASATKPGF